MGEHHLLQCLVFNKVRYALPVIKDVLYSHIRAGYITTHFWVSPISVHLNLLPFGIAVEPSSI
nr:MAG TPA: hypothetical protein [Caudoviricetes sp.]